MTIHTISLSELLALSPVIDLMRIRSCDPELYIVELEFDNMIYLVTDDGGDTLQYRGQIAAKKPFQSLRIKSAVLAHRSAYDEMVGQPPSNNDMEIPTTVPADSHLV